MTDHPVPPNPYGPNSRHHGLPVVTTTTADGRVVHTLARRLLRDPDDLVERSRVELRAGERMDEVAATHVGDPLAWWLLVEAHVVAHPAEVVAEPGAHVRIVQPPDPGGAA